MSQPTPTPPTDPTTAINAIAAATEALDQREPTDPTDRVERWQLAKLALDHLTVVVGQMAGEAVEAMAELGRETLDTRWGPVHTDRGYGREEWDGAALLGALASKLVNTTTGEVEEAVPVSVLRDVLPGVAPGRTSSRWGVTGLRKHGVRVDSYRRTEPAPNVIRLGERTRR